MSTYWRMIRAALAELEKTMEPFSQEKPCNLGATPHPAHDWTFSPSQRTPYRCPGYIR